MEKLELRFTYEKETRNTIRYQEELGKEALGDSPPQRLKDRS